MHEHTSDPASRQHSGPDFADSDDVPPARTGFGSDSAGENGKPELGPIRQVIAGTCPVTQHKNPVTGYIVPLCTVLWQ
jgi:hypothetical protein